MILQKLELLVWKNFILQIRRPIGTVVEILFPVAFVALLILARLNIDESENCFDVFDSESVIKLESEFHLVRKNNTYETVLNTRTRLAFWPINDATTKLLEFASSEMNWNLSSRSLSNETFASKEEMIDEVKENSDKYLGVVEFKNINDDTKPLPEKVEYIIRLMHSDSKRGGRPSWRTQWIYPFFMVPGPRYGSDYLGTFSNLQYHIDSAIIQHHTGNQNISAIKKMQKFPYPNYYEDQFFSMLKSLMPMLLVLAFMYSASTIVKELVAEKQERLKESMRIMGLPNWIHWLAWFIKTFFFLFCTVLLLIALLKLGDIIKFTDVGVLLFVFVLYLLATIASLFFISVFFSKAVVSMLFTSIIWFGSLSPYIAFSDDESFENLSGTEKGALCLFPNSCLGVMVQLLSQWEVEKIGVQWDNVGETYTVDDNFTMAQAFGMLILDCILYGILTWYIENVFPGEYGVPRPFYFPFMASYWCGTSKNISSDEPSSNKVRPQKNCEEEPSGLDVGVSLHGLRKVYKGATGKKVAVDNLTLNMYNGQITCLLGHNGAGKTTTMSILTGLFPPTSGMATINGKSIFTEMDSIRESLGLCPQHNVLFDRLTVYEHLVFFTALKGIPEVQAKAEIRTMLEDIQLRDKANQPSSTLSGGMKRKLNCAIALIGGSKIVFLDEPTSGMDPYARRATWDLLQKYRENKTIILTTHFMDEADYLADRIAIMSEGKLRCCGSSLFLKKRYGVGYHLTLVKGENFEETKTTSLLAESLPSSRLSSNIGAEMSYVLDSDSVQHFKKLFMTLEAEKDSYGISSFGVSVTTLEEVFLKVGEGENLQEEEENNTNDDTKLHVNLERQLSVLNKSDLKKGCALYMTQFYAMLVKRFLNSRRELKAIISLVVTPLLLVFVGLLLATQNGGSQSDDQILPLNVSMLKSKSSGVAVFFADFTNDPKTVKKMAENYFSSFGVTMKDRTNETKLLKTSNQGNSINTPYTSPKIATVRKEKVDCCDYKYFILNENCKNEFGNFTGYNEMCKKAGKGTKCEDGFKRVDGHDSNLYFTEYVLEDSGSNLKNYFIDNVAGVTFDDTQGINVWYSNQGLHTVMAAYSAGNNILLKHLLSDKNYGIFTSNHPLPRSSKEQLDLTKTNPSSVTLVIFICMAASLIAASFITFIVNEKTSKAKHVQFVSGVNSVCYWGGAYCWDFVSYLVPAVGIIIMIVAFDPVDYENDLGAVIIVVLLHGMAIIPFVYLISFVFTSALIAYSVVGVLLMLICLGMVIAIFVLRLVEEDDIAVTLNYLFMILPTYTFSQAMSDISTNAGRIKSCNQTENTIAACKKDNILYFENSLNMEFPGVGLNCLVMFLEGIVYFVLIILIEERFFLGGLFVKKHTAVYQPQQEDGDVSAEREKVKNMTMDEVKDSALVTEDITKVYRSNGMMAVNHLSVAIPRGECFGLLGVNGAGKTTTFGMLTGELSLSGGSAHLMGFDLQSQLKDVQQRVGYCPQFDALVERLTGREMLRIFARLRGVASNAIEDVISAAIEQLNLEKWADKMCGSYSGGNKRKLSTAMALVGDPSIVFLDEPTSGMDPASRRFLWNTLISKLDGGRSIVLTSHSMEECEALCNRLVIMVNGQFKCIGSIQHLKSRFGQGYTVMMKVSNAKNNNAKRPSLSLSNPSYMSEQEETIYDSSSTALQQMGDSATLLELTTRVKDFMAEKFPGSILLEDRQGLVQYQILDPNVLWSNMFGTLEENASRFSIVDYSVSQTTLEQVFITFAKYQHSEERVKKSTCCSCTCF